MHTNYDPIPTTKRSSSVFADASGDEVWLSIQIANGSANVTLTEAQAHMLIDRLMAIVTALGSDK